MNDHLFEMETIVNLIEELNPIVKNEHWEEVGHFDDIPIDVDWDRYKIIESAGNLRCYTIRPVGNDRVLQGYAIFFIGHHLHCKTTLVADQDAIFVRKPFRGIGKLFIEWCDSQLKLEGVNTVSHHIKPWFDWSPVIEKLGYKKAETVWIRRL